MTEHWTVRNADGTWPEDPPVCQCIVMRLREPRAGSGYEIAFQKLMPGISAMCFGNEPYIAAYFSLSPVEPELPKYDVRMSGPALTEFRPEVGVRYNDYYPALGEFCEYELNPGQWVDCEILSESDGQSRRYLARYVGNGGVQKTGMVSPGSLRAKQSCHSMNQEHPFLAALAAAGNTSPAVPFTNTDLAFASTALVASVFRTAKAACGHGRRSTRRFASRVTT